MTHSCKQALLWLAVRTDRVYIFLAGEIIEGSGSRMAFVLNLKTQLATENTEITEEKQAVVMKNAKHLLGESAEQGNTLNFSVFSVA